MEELLAYLARGLVDDPDAVIVERVEQDDGTIVLELEVPEGQVGHVIGRGGRTVTALRTVLRECAAQRDQRVVVEVIDA